MDLSRGLTTRGISASHSPRWRCLSAAGVAKRGRTRLTQRLNLVGRGACKIQLVPAVDPKWSRVRADGRDGQAQKSLAESSWLGRWPKRGLDERASSGMRGLGDLLLAIVVAIDMAGSSTAKRRLIVISPGAMHRVARNEE
jgi:hypothetical protein